MSILDLFDPTGNNFLGAGRVGGRVLADIMAPNMEFFRPDPFGFGRGTFAGKVGHGIGGAEQGAAGGFATGGVPGAVMGGVTGGVRSGLGDSEPYTLAGRGSGAAGNFGIGAGEGTLYSGAHALMGTPSATGSPGYPPGSAVQSLVSGRQNAQAQPAQPQQDRLAMIYKLFPRLRPGYGGPSYGL